MIARRGLATGVRRGRRDCGPSGGSNRENATMPDNTTTLATLKEAVRRFAAEREWEPYHSPKNLVMGLAVEAAELMEHFLWMENAASREIVRDPARLSEVADEMADVAVYLLNLSLTLGVDLS